MNEHYVVEDRGYDTPCWIWTEYINSDGYGKLPHGRGLAHRVLYEQVNVPLPDGLELDHLCRNRACVNPDHLEPVSHRENVWRGANAKLTFALATEIRDEYARWSATNAAFYRCWADRLGVTVGTIDHIVNWRSWLPPGMKSDRAKGVC